MVPRFALDQISWCSWKVYQPIHRVRPIEEPVTGIAIFIKTCFLEVSDPCQLLIKLYQYSIRKKINKTHAICTKNPVRYTCSSTNIVLCSANSAHLARFFRVHWTFVYWKVIFIYFLFVCFMARDTSTIKSLVRHHTVGYYLVSRWGGYPYLYCWQFTPTSHSSLFKISDVIRTCNPLTLRKERLRFWHSINILT